MLIRTSAVLHLLNNEAYEDIMSIWDKQSPLNYYYTSLCMLKQGHCGQEALTTVDLSARISTSKQVGNVQEMDAAASEASRTEGTNCPRFLYLFFFLNGTCETRIVCDHHSCWPPLSFPLCRCFCCSLCQCDEQLWLYMTACPVLCLFHLSPSGNLQPVYTLRRKEGRWLVCVCVRACGRVCMCVWDPSLTKFTSGCVHCDGGSNMEWYFN